MNYLNVLETTNFWGSLKKSPGKYRMSYVDFLLQQSQHDTISAVVGVRRSGKSTILRQVIHHLIHKQKVKPENTLLVNFEDPRLIGLLALGRKPCAF